MAELIGGLPGPAQTVLYFFLALFPLVLIHEIGHFAVAKLNAIRVDEFGLGFPPRLVKVFSRGGTDYTLNALPLGGFVRLAGEDDPSLPGAFAAASKRARAAVLFAGPCANFLLAAVVLAGVGMVFGIPQALPDGGGMVRVSQVLEGRPADAAGIEPGDVIYAVNGELLADLGRAMPSDVAELPAIQALKAKTNDSAGRAMEVTVLRGLEPVYAPLPDAGFDTERLDLPFAEARTVVATEPGAGELAVGDVIVDPPGAAVVVLRPVAGAVAAGGTGGAAVRWVRTLTVTPERAGPDEPAQMGIGIEGLSAVEHLGMLEALAYGPRQTAEIGVAMVGGLVDMITGAIAPAIAGPVGIANMGRQAGERGIETFLFFMALLSINLGIINLLPIPALDGGRLLFIAVEGVRGRRVEPTREAVVHLIGFALVLGLMAVITVWEVAKLSGVSAP